MPVVNIGTASNLFDAVEECLASHGLDFSKVLSFMSDTTNVMKGFQSGVQKLILCMMLDACHLADLAVEREPYLLILTSYLLIFSTQ